MMRKGPPMQSLSGANRGTDKTVRLFVSGSDDPGATAMRYYFDLNENGRLSRDDIGVTLNSEEAARTEGMAALSEMSRDLLSDGDQRIVIAIRDEDGRQVMQLMLCFAISA